MDIKLAVHFLWNYFYNKWFFAVLSIVIAIVFIIISYYQGWLNDLFCNHEKNGASEFVATILVGMAAFFLGIVQLKSNNDTFKRELYANFNSRYDKLNQCLNNISNENTCQENTNNEKPKDQSRELDSNKSDKCCCCNPNEKRKIDEVINDYINLCAEEYFWYRKGRIEWEVWQHWKAGMIYHFNKKQVQCILRRELSQKDSYYRLYEMPEVNMIISGKCDRQYCSCKCTISNNND